MNALPGLVPGLVISLILGLVVGRRVGRRLGSRPWVGGAMIVSLGLVIAATVTPLRGAVQSGALGSGTCDLSRMGLAPISALGELTDTTLNVLLFVPLGVTVGLLRRSRSKTALIFGTSMLPMVIEAVQLLVPSLARGCESADVFDNLSGLVVGLAIGGILGRARQ